MAAGILLSAAALVVTFTGATAVRLHGRDIRLGDVARVEGEGADAALRTVIGRVPEGQAIGVSTDRLRELAARAIPGARFALTRPRQVVMVAPAVMRPGPHCVEAAKDIAAGARLAQGDVRAAACSARAAAAVTGDGRGAPKAGRAIAAGDYLGPLLIAQAPLAERGDKLTLVSRAGPVTVAREVVALQEARAPDGRLFVRTVDGEVLAAKLRTEQAR